MHGRYRDASYPETLDAEQCAAVTAPCDRPVLVVSGAGCGKTRVLTMRMVHCVRRGMRPQRMCAITFTRNAARQMRERIGRYAEFATAAPARITTFHGLCYALLHQRIEGMPTFRRLGYTAAPAVISRDGMYRGIVQCTSKAERMRLRADVAAIASMISCRRLNHERFSLRYPVACAHIDTVIARLAAYKKAHGVWDFADMIEHALYLLRNDRACRTYYEHRFDVILVDEYQDVNPLQVALVRRLTGTRTHLFAVGDDDQAIYGFRGADCTQIHRFGQTFPHALQYKLQTNYRSAVCILHTANRVFANKPPAFRTVLRGPLPRRPQAHQAAIIVRKRFPHQAAWLQWLVDRIEYICTAYGHGYDEIAVLCRTNETRRTVYHWLRHTKEALYRGLQCMTVHASKGMEFSVVFLCDLEEGVFPCVHPQRQTRPAAWIRSLLHNLFSANRRTHRAMQARVQTQTLEEEKRLFYVAVTRAQQQLYCCSVVRRKKGGRTRRCSVSRFCRYIKPVSRQSHLSRAVVWVGAAIRVSLVRLWE